MKPRLYVHLGMPKTGTTSLQTQYFPSICAANDWAYFGKTYNNHLTADENKELWEFINEIRTRDEIYIRANAQRIAKKYFQPSHQTTLFSAETFIFDSFRYRLLHGTLLTNDISSTFRKLHLVLAAADKLPHLILVIRNQKSIIPSLYAEAYTSHFRHVKELNSLDKFLDQIPPGSKYSHIFSCLNYKAIYDVALATFGNECISLLPYELLDSSPQEFSGALSQILHIQEPAKVACHANRRHSNDGWRSSGVSALSPAKWIADKLFQGSHKTWRVTKVIKPILSSVKVSAPKSFSLTEEQLNAISSRFSESNQAIDQTVSLNLKDFGYY